MITIKTFTGALHGFGSTNLIIINERGVILGKQLLLLKTI